MYYDETAGSYSITLTNDSSLTNPSAYPFTVDPAALEHITIGPASATITAGGSRAYTAEAFDQYGNSRGDVTGSTTFTIDPDGSCTGASCTATVAGDHTVTGTFSGKSDQATLHVDAAAASKLVLSGSDTDLASGSDRTLTATVVDANGNTTTGDDSTQVTFSKSAGTGSVTGLGAVTVAGGVATRTVTGGLAGPVTIAASVPSLSSDSLSFTVVPGPASTATTITANPTTIPADGSSISTITVLAKDTAGNQLTEGGDTVTLATTVGSLSAVTDHGNGTYTATLTSSIGGTATTTGTIAGGTIANTATVELIAAPQLVSETPADGSVVGSISKWTLTASENVSWTNVRVIRTSDGKVTKLKSGSGVSITRKFSATDPTLYRIRAKISDGINQPVNVVSHSTIRDPSNDSPSTAVVAPPGEPGQLRSSTGLLTMSWPASAVTDWTIVTITPTPAKAPPCEECALPDEVYDIVAQKMQDDSLIHSFPAALHFRVPVDDATVVPWTRDGTAPWRQLLPITDPSAGLPDGWNDGYWLETVGTGKKAKRFLYMYTRHLSQFALAKPANSSRALKLTLHAGKRISFKRRAIWVRTDLSLTSTLVLSLRKKGRPVAAMEKRVRAGSSFVRFGLLHKIKLPGFYTLRAVAYSFRHKVKRSATVSFVKTEKRKVSCAARGRRVSPTRVPIASSDGGEIAQHLHKPLRPQLGVTTNTLYDVVTAAGGNVKVAVLDLRLIRLESVRQFRLVYPTTKIVVLTNRPGQARRIKRAGAAKVFSTSASPETIARGITQLIRGQTVVVSHARSRAGTLRAPIPLGCTAGLGNGFRLRVVSAIPNATDSILESSSSNRPPAARRQFFMVKIFVERTGKGATYLHAGFRFRAIGRSKHRYSTFDNSCGLLPALDLQIHDKRIRPGRSVQGNVCWQVRKRDTKKLVMYNTGGKAGGKRIYFALH